MEPPLPNEVLDLPFVWRAMEWAKPDGQIAFALHARLLFQQGDGMPTAREALFEALDVTSVINGVELRQTKVWPQISAPFCILFATNRIPGVEAGFRFVSPRIEDTLNSAGGMRIDAVNAEVVASHRLVDTPEILKILFRGSKADFGILQRIRAQGYPTLHDFWREEIGVGDRRRLRGSGNGYQTLSSPWQKSRIRLGPGAAEPRRLHGMAMGKRPVARQASPLWVETADLPTSDGHPFFERLNRVLEDCGFDAFVEGLCSAFYAARMGRPSLRPGRYFRMLLIGYFEGLSSERGIAWRVADSLSLRSFLDLELTESAPDHSTLSRTRRLIDVETHEAVFTWVLERLSEAGLVVGKTVGIDATTLEANAAMRSIERRDTGESYEAFIRRLAEASGVETPTRAELARFDRSRKNKKTSNKEWKSPQDPDAKIAKMKDGRTHLAHKAEHGVDMDTGAIVSVTVQDASDGDTATLPETLIMAAEQVEAVQPEGAGVEEVVADKGYHSDETLVGLGEVGVRSHVSEPERGRRCWQDKKTGETPPEKRAAQKALYANRRRVRGRRGRRLQRRRGEVVERTFAHMYETGGMRRVWVRGHDNVRKRVLLQAAACNIGLLLRRQTGVGTPRSLQGRALSAIYGLIGRWRGCWERLRRVWGLKRSMLHLEAA